MRTAIEMCECPRSVMEPHRMNAEHVQPSKPETTEDMVILIDRRINEVFYRSSLHKNECAKIFEGLPVEWEPGREYQTRTEVVDMLLDTRYTLTGPTAEERMNEPEETNDGELQEELDALIGADLNAG